MADEGRTLVAQLIERGVQLRRDGQQLRLRALPGTLDAPLRDALVRHKPALLRLLSEDDGLAPLGDAQQQIWFAEQLTPGSDAHIIEIRAQLQGTLDRAALQRALNVIVTRHEPLRARLVQLHGLPALAIRPPEPNLISERVDDAPFELTRGPLFRIALQAQAPEQHRLVMRAHHVIFDGTSVRLLLDELSALYNAFRGGLPSPVLPELTCSYRDILLEQQKIAASAAFAQRLQRSVERLQTSQATCLPTDSGAGTEARTAQPRPQRTLPDALAARVRALARDARTTPSSVISAALALIVSRLSGEDDITLGVPLSGRHTPQRAALIGMLVETGVLRLQVGETSTFEALLQQTGERMLELQEHADIPLHRIAAQLDTCRAGAPRQLFDIMINYIALPPPALQLDGVSAQVSEHMGGSRFGATVYVYDQQGRLTLTAAHDPERYASGRMHELLAQMIRVLQQVCDQPGQPCTQISLRTDSTPHIAVSRSSGEASKVSRTLEATACAMATREALLYRGRGYRYDELDRASADIAAIIAKADIPGNARVALLAPRSAAFVAALWGIWRAGCSLVVLDPAHPSHHLNAQLAVARPHLLLCHQPPPAGLEAGQSGPLVVGLPRLDGSAAATETMSAHAGEAAGATTETPKPPHTSARGTPGDEAYVAFTSGTTARPRAIHAGHEPLDHFFAWYLRTFALGPDDRFAMLSGLSHDPLLRDVLAPLLIGASVLIPPQPPALMGTTISPWLQHTEASVLHATPTLAQLILLGAQVNGIRTLDKLRYVFFGGEALHGELAQKLAALAPQAQLINLYGTTETPQAVGFRVLKPADHHASIVSIGRGIDDTELCVLDDRGKPAGLGELGHIHVCTRFLSRGYLNDAQAAAKHFVGPGCYRTGDLGRIRLDGNIDFAGRADRQLKIRGVRIEPEAIESILTAHPAVRAAAVVALSDERGGYSIIAHVERAAAASRSQLRAFLEQRLPPAMQPARVQLHDALPLTSRGKIDRQRLRHMTDDEEPSGAQAAQPAESRLLPLVAELWRQTLGLEQLDPGAHFFALGGHSLAAARLTARLQEQLALQVPVSLIFEEPTLAGYCRRLSNLRVGARTLPRLPPDAPLPLSFAQRRLWFVEQLADKAPPYHIVQTTRIEGALDTQALDKALVQLERRHEALRMRFAGRATEVTLKLREPRESVLELRATDAELPRLTGDGEPLWRARLSSAAGEHTLQIVMHHAISDGWSMRIFNQELAEAYRAARLGTAPPPAPPGLRYVDYAHWQQQCMQGDFVTQQRAFWQRQLDGLPALALPSRHEPPAARSWQAGSHTTRLSGETWSRLRALAAGDSATPFMLLYAGLLALLTRYCDATDIAIGTPHSQRPSLAAEQVIGLFLNVLVLRTSSAGDPSFRQLLRRARETALAAWAHAELPFEQVVAAAAPTRPHGQRPLFRVFLNVMQGPASTLQLEGARCSRNDDSTPPARVDLTLYAITERDAVQLRLVYARDLFDGEQIRRMSEHLHELLEHIAHAPDTPLSALPLSALPAAQAASASPPPPPAGSLLSELWQVARAHAARPAVIDSGDQPTSYGQLWSRALQLAEQIHRQLPAGAHVGLLLDKDAGMLVGLLGCLIAGRPYVPLAPDLPEQRLHTLCEDAELRGLLYSPPLRSTAQALAGPKLLLIELPPQTVTSGPAPLPASPVLGEVTDDQLAYILYTSGSTGRPKGVMQSRAGLLRHARNYIDRLGIAPHDRLSLLSTYAFDAAIMDIFGACLSGAALCPIGKHELPALWETLQQRRVTVYHSTPTVYRHLLSSAALTDSETGFEPSARLSRIRWVVLGGEEVRPADLEGFEQHFPSHCRFINGLGPTECTLALQWELDRTAPMRSRHVPVGRPVPGIVVSLQARTGAQVASFGSGEIILSGEQLALGYWRRPEQTRRAFSISADGRRQYRSGDMGRWLADGCISFIGRNDDQLKLRGYRIEPGEIIDCLRAHERVSAAAVMVAGEGSDAQLIAHVAGDSITTAALRTWCSAVLPPWQVPGAFVLHDALPTTATGKIDRRALAAQQPVIERPRTKAPADALHRQLAAVWAELLGVEEPAAEADFFEQGGHSLLALTLIQRVKKELGIDVALPSFLEEPTLAALGNMVAAGGMMSVTQRRARLVQLKEGPAPLLLLITPPGARAHIYEPLSAYWQGAIVALEAPGFGSRGPRPALEQLAARCRAALTAGRPLGGLGALSDPKAARTTTLAGFSHGGVLAFELARQLERAGTPVRRLLLLDSFAPQTLRTGEATRATRELSFAMALAGRAPPRQAHDAVLRWLLDTAKRSGQLSATTGLSEIEAMFTHFCQHAERARDAIRGYRPARYHGAVTLFRATHSASEIAKRAATAQSSQRDEWHELAPALRRYDFVGSHHEAISARRVARYLRGLTETREQSPAPGEDDGRRQRQHHAPASE